MIRVSGLTKSFGQKIVLNDISFEAPKGEALVFIGPSGCGKSVLLKCILGLTQVDSGEIWIDKDRISDLNPKDKMRVRLRFGILFQHGALLDSLSVEENVAFALVEHTKMTKVEIRTRVQESLGLVGLPDTGHMMPHELSGGMKKRVALARAISMRPEILLFDEPTAGLDPLTTDTINKLMVQLKKTLNTTCIAVTHDISTAFTLADKVSLLHEGKLRFTGSPEDVRQSTDPLLYGFAGKH